MQQMLPSIRSIAGVAYIFQQDSALAHCARQMAERETPKFSAADLCPPNSPDLACNSLLGVRQSDIGRTSSVRRRRLFSKHAARPTVACRL